MAPISSLALLLVLILLPTLQAGSGEPDARPDDERLQFLSSIHIPEGVTVAEAVCILCSIQVDGAVTEEAVALWGSVTVSGSVAEEVVATGGNVHLLSGSHVGSEVVAVGGNVIRDPEAVGEGSISELPYLFFPGQWTFPWPGAPLFAVVTGILLWLATLALGKTKTGRMKAALVQRPITTFLLGILAAAVIWMLAEVTPSLGALDDWVEFGLTALLLVPAWLGTPGLTFWLGMRTAPAHPVLAGSFLLLVLFFIPAVGLAVSLVVFVFALGTATLSGFGTAPDWLLRPFRKQVAEESE